MLLENEALINDARALVADLREWLDRHRPKENKRRLNAPDPELLKILTRHCEQFDMNGVDEAMEQLESASYENDNDLIKWLREKVDTSDFTVIAERLNALIF